LCGPKGAGGIGGLMQYEAFIETIEQLDPDYADLVV
jgi:hypothetical protein